MTTTRSPRSLREAELAAAGHRPGRRLSRLRASGERFADDVTAELTALAMPHARISVALTRSASRGRTAPTTWKSASPPTRERPALPLHKCLSGERSRVMLAIEVVLRGRGPGPDVRFDEVDAASAARPRRDRPPPR